MFGFSLGKLLVLILLIAIVWYGFNLMNRRNRLAAERAAREAVDRKLKAARLKRDEAAQDMSKCPVCNTFVPVDGARNCGRDGCPYAG